MVAGEVVNEGGRFTRIDRAPIAERREAGYRDMRAALAAAPWLRQEMPAHLGALVHRGRAGEGEYEPEPSLHGTTDKLAAA